jgi:protein SCO1/2
MSMRTRETAALGALGAILAITIIWWALALWPLADSAPAWLLRTRVVCFGSTSSGLPDAGGWLALIGEPLLLLGTLLTVWGGAVVHALRVLGRSGTGRSALSAASLLLLALTAAATVRVAGATGRPAPAAMLPDPAYPRLDRPAPPLDLVDQDGAPVTLERFRGRSVVVAFVYGHCQTVCPLVVEDVLRARRLLGDRAPAALFVTLDPWRDTPARLPSLAAQWRLEGEAFVAGGSIPAVEAALDRWSVSRARDQRTGEVTHATVVYLVDRQGRIAFAVTGGAQAIAALAMRLP